MAPVPTEVDVIIAGGGAAGCVVAGRLAAADPSLEILVVETGANNYMDPKVIHPMFYLSHLHPSSTTARFYSGNKSEHLGGRSPIVPTGNILGGGSSINFMMYTRGNASDYDDWKTEGWSSADLIPLLRKLEKSHISDNMKLHGKRGPINISHGGYQHEQVRDEWLQAAQDKTNLPVKDDIQDLKTVNAFQKWGKFIDPVTGKRQDAAHTYVHPQTAQNRNLHILCESQVSRIVIYDGKAVGVEYVSSVPFEEGSYGTRHVSFIKARKLVVLSAGSLGSPQILERSGVGNPEIIRKAGIFPLVNLPGVGTQYQDHLLMLPTYSVDPEMDTADDVLRGKPEIMAKAFEDAKGGRGRLTTNMIDAGGKLRPSKEQLRAMSPEFRQYWNEYFHGSDKPVLCLALLSSFLGDHSLINEGRYLTMAYYLEYPAGRGSIHIKSSSPYAEPEFDAGFLSHKADMAPMVWGYKLGRDIMRRMPSFRGEPVGLHPKFAANSKARCVDPDSDKSDDFRAAAEDALPAVGHRHNTRTASYETGNSDVVYSKDDDKAIEQYIRENVSTTWHSLGTCAMKPLEQGGVVDSKLNVYGVENLKIADLSICPGNVGANTYNTALMVGEKAALLIGEQLGIEIA